jgi:hypothetical protein
MLDAYFGQAELSGYVAITQPTTHQAIDGAKDSYLLPENFHSVTPLNLPIHTALETLHGR